MEATNNLKETLTLRWRKTMQRLNNEFEAGKIRDPVFARQDWDTAYGKIETVFETLTAAATSSEDRETLTDEWATFESEYSDMRGRLTELAESRNTTGTEPISGSQVSSNKPQYEKQRLNLPKFSGKTEEWAQFAALFKSGMSRYENLNESEKLQFLMDCLSGEAKRHVACYSTLVNAYTKAWQRLEEQYDRPVDQKLSIISGLLHLPVTKGSSDLGRLYNAVKDALGQMESMGTVIQDNDNTWVAIVADKLDKTTYSKWRRDINQHEELSLGQILRFVQKESELLCPASTMSPAGSSSSFSGTSKSKVCPDKSCKLEHPLYRCPTFGKATIDERWETAKKYNVCTNCLQTGHSFAACTRQHCQKCTKKHNTMLHRDAKPVQASLQCQGEVLLPTALVTIQSINSTPVKCRLFLDSGAQSSLISEEARMKLGLPGVQSSTVFTTADGQTCQSNEKIKCTISSCITNFKLPVTLQVVSRIASELPAYPVNANELKQLVAGKDLADPSFHTPGAVDLLLGADYYPMLLNGQCSSNGAAVAQSTKLGWVIFGNTTTLTMRPEKKNVVALTVRNPSFQRFWELEELPVTKRLTREESTVEQFMDTTTTRGPDGKFIMRMPLKSDPPPLGASRQMAVARLLSLERKFKNDSIFEKDYKAVIAEYMTLGHIEPAPESNARVSYIPHHAVIRKDAVTTKLRVVFDASAKSSNGVSLNECQANGPKLQEDIFSVLVRFRMHPVALTADIAKMYRQVWVHPDDRDLQRIVWRNNVSEPIQDWRLTTVTFGEKAAPYMAIKALKTLAKSCDDQRIAQIIERDFYVDDLLSGAESPAAAAEIQQSLQQILASGGFPTHKWASNSSAALVNVPPRDRADQMCLDFANSIKTLGICWDTKSDKFVIQVTPPPNRKWTRRSMLSVANSLFDPLGWLSPVTIVAKLQMQKVIQETSDWDAALTIAQTTQWEQWVKQLQNLHVQLPRCVAPQATAVFLCGFSDASEKAYGACVYARAVDSVGACTVRLVAAKTKVAPLHPVTLPRLELLGAHLLAQLLVSVAASLSIPTSNIRAWTDSTVTLAWIQSDASRWMTFVANRVAAIQSSVPPDQWAHVKTNENPADFLSRGMPADQLQHAALWWFGPCWLRLGLNSGSSPNASFAPEEKKTPVVASVTSPPPSVHELLRMYSSYAKLRRVVARVIQFTDRVRKKEVNSVNIFKRADMTIARWVQAETFSDEIGCLRLGRSVVLKSPLAPLNPVLDASDGLLRVGGRLTHASQLPAASRNPIILPSNHHVTRLVIEDAHLKCLHGGNTITESLLRKHFWILRPTSTVKNVLRRCVVCTRHKARTAKQMMAALPTVRVTPSRPFSNTGIDFAGPVQLRTHLARGSRTYKAWIAVFICLSTRAIHLELVTSLSTEALQAAITRFASRRGLPTNIYSDQGTNFISAAREFAAILRSEPMQDQGLQWHFNPPSAPHFGGIWEAGVKSMKTHLRRVLGNSTLNFEEFSTLLCRIEAVLNSRPLLPVSADPEDLDALTPAHFLVGGCLLNPPEEDVQTCNIHTLRRWQLVQKLSQDFWSRWSAEYLTRLQSRPKWLQLQANIDVNTLVLIKDTNQPPLHWRLGRVTEVHPGTDGAVRVATLKTAYGEVQRPIHKLCVLPLDGKQAENNDEDDSTSAPPLPDTGIVQTTTADGTGRLKKASQPTRRQPARKCKK